MLYEYALYYLFRCHMIIQPRDGQQVDRDMSSSPSRLPFIFFSNSFKNQLKHLLFFCKLHILVQPKNKN
jgi:hypothetical protein